MLNKEVNSVTVSLAVAQLLYLEGRDPSKGISPYINSPSGSITAGLAIYDTMQRIKCDVSTIYIGTTTSMGTFLLVADAEGKRFALPNSEVMIRQPNGSVQGQATNIMIHADHIIVIKRKPNEILTEKTGQPIEVITKDTERDNLMTAEQVVIYGLVNKVIIKR